MNTNLPHAAQPLGERIAATRERLYKLYLGPDTANATAFDWEAHNAKPIEERIESRRKRLYRLYGLEAQDKIDS